MKNIKDNENQINDAQPKMKTCKKIKNEYMMLRKNEKLFKITEDINFSELCITSYAKTKKIDTNDIEVVTTKAEGKKCPVCWKINKDGCERHST